MKRFVTLLTLLCLCFSITSCSSEAPFSLRNGYTWGMTKEEALALAKQENLTAAPEQQPGKLLFEDVPLGGKANAQFGLSFYDMWSSDPLDDSLQTIIYSFPNDDQGEQAVTELGEFLLKGLTDAYGKQYESTQTDATSTCTWRLPDTEISFIAWRFDSSIPYSIHYKRKTATENTPISNDGF